MSLPSTKVQEWVRDGYIISTDPKLIDIKALNAAFTSDQLPWAQHLPEDELRAVVEKSVCFGLYSPTAQALPATDTSAPKDPNDSTTAPQAQSPADTLHEVAQRVHITEQTDSAATTSGSDRPAMIGLARLITDYVTVVWLTDVYVLPEWQGRGLGSWLNQCVKEYIDEMPYLRRFSLIASEGKGEQYYGKVFGTSRMEDGGSGYRIYSTRGRAGQV